MKKLFTICAIATTLALGACKVQVNSHDKVSAPTEEKAPVAATEKAPENTEKK